MCIHFQLGESLCIRLISLEFFGSKAILADYEVLLNKVDTPPWGRGVSAGIRRIKENLGGIRRIKENFAGFGLSGIRISKDERALERVKIGQLSVNRENFPPAAG